MANTIQQKLGTAINQLSNHGLNLFAILKYSRLSTPAKGAFDSLRPPPSENARIVLIGNGGQALWQCLPATYRRRPDPIDRFSREIALTFAEAVLGEADYQILYPGTVPIPLQQLGRIVGWHTTSPLGLGIHPQWGLWYAYRAAILTNAPLPEMLAPAPTPPCDHCDVKPCLAACPSQALSSERAIDMSRCGTYRLTPDSSCADRCLARLSCPVSIEHRYTLKQVQYHYRLSLETLRHYSD